MGANSRSVTYGVDVVFCIDATESMFPFLGVVKENALHFYQDFMRIMEQKQKKVEAPRACRRFSGTIWQDGREAMLVTNFFELPAQSVSWRPASAVLRPRAAETIPRTAWRRLPMRLSPTGIPNQKESAMSLRSGRMLHMISDSGRAAKELPPRHG